MRKLTIHIGMAKTGTTTLQKTLAGYDDGHTVFCSFRKADMAVALHTIFSSDRHNSHVHKRLLRTPGEIDALRDEYLTELEEGLAKPFANFIISSEAFTSLSEEDVVSCVKFFQKYVDEVRFVAYIRKPFSYMQSLMQQKIKGGYCEFSIPLPRYRSQFEKFVKNFGRSSIDFIEFDKSALYQGDIVSDFCYRFGMRAPSRANIQNNGLGLEACCLLYVQNKKGVGNFTTRELAEARGFLHALLSRVGSNKFQVSHTILEAAVKRGDILWMENETGISLSEDKTQRGPYISSEEDIFQIAHDNLPAFKEEAARFLSENFLTIDRPQDALSRFLQVVPILEIGRE